MSSIWITSASTTRRRIYLQPKIPTELFGEPPRDANAHFFTANTGYPSYFGAKPINSSGTVQAERVLRRHRCQHPGRGRGSDAQDGDECLSRDHCLKRLCTGGRRGAQQRGQRTDIAGDAVRGDFSSQPAAGDAGGALGAALFGYHSVPRKSTILHDAACLLGRRTRSSRGGKIPGKQQRSSPPALQFGRESDKGKRPSAACSRGK